MTNAEGILSSFGDELTELAGFWSTRTTAQVQAEQQVQDGSGTATGSFAVTALLGTWEWRGSQNTVSGSVPRTILATNTTQVAVDDYIRLDSDGQFFQIQNISSGTGPGGEDEVTISNPTGLTVPTGTGASSLSDPCVVTIPGTPDFLVTIAAGMRFRILTGVLAGLTGVVDTRDSGTQITLLTGFPAAFATESWEIVIDADTSIPVESTLNFDSSGRVVIDGRVYNYSSTTITSFDGITYDDGTGVLISGVSQDHAPITGVADFSRTVTALDQYRSSFLVNLATGSDLDIVGRNVGVPRPAALGDDDIYRELIKAVAYAPRGTIFAIEQALDVLIGPGLYAIFEDLTSASPLQKPATVYITALGTTSTRYVGKAYLEGHDAELLPLLDTTQIDLPDDLFVTFAGLHPAPEGGFRDIDGSTTNLVSSADLGVTITGPVGTFSTRIQPGDILQLRDGPYRGLQGTIQSRTSDQQIVLGVVQGASMVGTTDDGSIGVNFSGVSWRVIRDKSNVRFYRPSAEQILEGGNIVSPWAYVGGGLEATRVTPNFTGGAIYNSLLFNTNNDIVAYRKILRVRPEDTVIIEAHLDVDSGQTSGDSPEQHAIVFADGNRFITFGTQRDSVQAHINAGMFNLNTGAFLTAGGDFIWSNVANTVFVPGYNTVIIEKRGTQDIRLWRKNDAGGAAFNVNNTPLELVAVYPYTSFLDVATAIPLLSYTSPTAKDLAFGTLITGMTIQTQWRHVDFKVIPKSEFANHNHPITVGNTTATNQVTTTGTFATGVFPPAGDDVGRHVLIRDSQGVNAGGGNALGDWEVTQQTNPTTLVVTGATRNRGSFTLQNRSWLVVRDREDAFIWPRHMGHSVEILDGPNAGTYPILDIIDEATGKRFEDPPQNANDSNVGLLAVELRSTDPADGTSAIFLNGEGPAIRVVGQVGGAQTITQEGLLSPDHFPGITGTGLSAAFDASSIVAMELVPVIINGRRSPLTFNGDLILYNTADDSEILRIPAGETTAGKDTLRQLKSVDGAFFDSVGAPLVGPVNTVQSQPVEHRSGTVLLDTSALSGGLFTVDANEVRWRIIPSFPAADATLDVVDCLLETATADRYARRDTPVWPGDYGPGLELMSVFRSTVRTGQMHDIPYRNDVNNYATQDYDLYPFYLTDQFGYARRIVDALTAAGVIADFGVFVDATGFHLQE